MTKITISSDLVGLPWQQQVHDGNFKHVFLYTSMLSFNCEEKIYIIKVKDFSHNFRAIKGRGHHLYQLCRLVSPTVHDHQTSGSKEDF